MLSVRLVMTAGLMILVGCATGPRVPAPGVVTPDNAELFGLQGGIYVHVTGVQTTRAGIYGVLGIRGLAENRTGKKLAMCTIHFQLISEHGSVVASASAFTQHLAPGQRWEFQAPISTPYGVLFSEVRVGGVTATPASLR